MSRSPLGFFIRNRTAAYVAFIAVHSFVFAFQSTELLREWADGSTVFSRRSGIGSIPWSYALVNLVIYAAGFGLVTLGQAIRTRRRATATEAVDLAR